MALVIKKAGLATSIQDGGRRGVQHLGVPRSGAADVLSLSLANYLVGKDSDAPAFEFTLSGATVVFKTRLAFALTGAHAQCVLNGTFVPLYEQVLARFGDVLVISPITVGARLYMAVSSDIEVERVLGSYSTYAAGGFGGFGGFGGRMLADGDVVRMRSTRPLPPPRRVEKQYRPIITKHIVVRAVFGTEIHQLYQHSRHVLFTQPFMVSARASRMGVELERPTLTLESRSVMKSSAVFPGTVQCPPSGKPFLLLCDAQTTGVPPNCAGYSCGEALTGAAVCR